MNKYLVELEASEEWNKDAPTQVLISISEKMVANIKQAKDFIEAINKNKKVTYFNKRDYSLEYVDNNEFKDVKEFDTEQIVVEGISEPMFIAYKKTARSEKIIGKIDLNNPIKENDIQKLNLIGTNK
ncbi:hypothetical protein A3715_19730 [Oleiphilus sp. HI0009]|nr:hypothetical protein A3715_19730 [Oleiphilus sp. HI0009]